MRVLIITVLFHLACCTLKLKPRFEWNFLEYSFEEDNFGKRRNNIPTGLDVYEDKLFIIVPRWHEYDVPSTLNYISLKDSSTSPKLIPYPSLDETSTIKSAVSIRVDRCERLWVLDSGKKGDPTFTANKDDLSPAILVYNLTNNQVEYRYALPEDQFDDTSYFSTIVVEDYKCTNTYAYIGDASNGTIVVYSLAQNSSWIKTHELFKTRDYGKNEVNILDMSISKHKFDEFSTLYFHPIDSKDVFSISTRFMRNDSISICDSKGNYVHVLGARDYSSASFVDDRSGILFYSLVNSDGIACWNTTKEYETATQGLVYSDNNTMIYPADIKVDSKDNLWILTNNMQEYNNGFLDLDNINFRIFSVPVSDAIKNTVCGNKVPVLDLVKNTETESNSTNVHLNSAGLFRSNHTILTVMAIVSFLLAVCVPQLREGHPSFLWLSY